MRKQKSIGNVNKKKKMSNNYISSMHNKSDPPLNKAMPKLVFYWAEHF